MFGCKQRFLCTHGESDRTSCLQAYPFLVCLWEERSTDLTTDLGPWAGREQQRIGHGTPSSPIPKLQTRFTLRPHRWTWKPLSPHGLKNKGAGPLDRRTSHEGGHTQGANTKAPPELPVLPPASANNEHKTRIFYHERTLSEEGERAMHVWTCSTFCFFRKLLQVYDIGVFAFDIWKWM